MRMRKKYYFIFAMILIILLSLIFSYHSQKEEKKTVVFDKTESLILDYEEKLLYATRFTLTHYKGGYTMFSIPGIDEDRQYLIVPEGKSIPENLSANTIIIQQPVTRICFASGGMASLAEAIGRLDCMTTTAIDSDAWALDSIAEKMKEREILYSGEFRNPDFELLLSEKIQLEIDTTMLLNYPDIRDKYDELGIPYFIEDSSKESHPLGRMEWIKLLGEILNEREAARSYFDEQVEKVKALETIEKTGKTAALFYIGEDTVYVRNAGDYIPAMLMLAGGECITADVNPEQGGNAKFSFEDFYSRCKDADYLFWVVLACPYDTLEELVASNELFADFKAVQNGNVYSSKRGFAQSTARLADVILEMNRILNHTDVEETETFVKLK